MKDLINHHLNNYTAKELSQKTGIPHQIIRAISTGGYVAKKHRDNEEYLEALKQLNQRPESCPVDAIVSGSFDFPKELEMGVAPTFCPRCSPNTWGNHKVMFVPDVQVCNECGHRYEFNKAEKDH